jgi:voltage-gated potassium channel Kch
VLPLVLAFHKLSRAILAVWRDPETKALPVVAGALIVSGTIFYWRVEDWTIIQSLYFSVVTLTTVGFGDFTPTTPGAQIFTIFYILTGIGVFVALLASVAQQYIAQKTESPSARERLSARRQRRQGE